MSCQVKDRRRARDQSRSQTLHSQLVAREARREAEMLVRREEGERKRKARQEDALVRGQMAAIRREMREERERRRWVWQGRRGEEEWVLTSYIAAINCAHGTLGQQFMAAI